MSSSSSSSLQCNDITDIPKTIKTNINTIAASDIIFYLALSPPVIIIIKTITNAITDIIIIVNNSSDILTLSVSINKDIILP